MSLGPDARALIDAASGADDPSDADAARVRSKLTTRFGVAAAAGAAAAAGSKASAASAGAGAAVGTGVGTGAKVLLVVALVASASVPLTVALRSEDPITAHAPVSTSERSLVKRAPLPPIASTSPLSAPPSALLSAARVEPPRPNVHVDPPAPRAATPRSPGERAEPSYRGPMSPPLSAPPTATGGGPDSVAAEAALLREARTAIARGDVASALAAIDAHAARFPHGALSEERQASRVFALCAGGQAAEARAAASAFVAASPRSPLVDQVRRSCAAKDVPGQ